MISVIMGVYNGEKTVQRAVLSITQGTYTDIEFVIVDDGSTDNTWDVLQSLKESDSRIVVIKSDINNGLAFALNTALNSSKGEYVARMDSDDFSYPTRLEKQLEYLESSGLDFVGTGAKLVDNGLVWGERKFSKVVDKDTLKKYNPFIHPTLLIKRDALTKVGGYNEAKYCHRCEDYDLYFRLYAKGFVGGNMQEILMDYSENRNSADRHNRQTRKNEFIVRRRGIKLLKGHLWDYMYCVKPLILLLLTDKLYNRMHNYKWRNNEEI